MGWECGMYDGRRGVYSVLVGETAGERGHVEDLDVDMMIRVKLFKIYDVAVWSGLIWLTTGTTEEIF
jgi:hypothetical protein